MALLSGCGADATAALATRLLENDCATVCACGVPALAKNFMFSEISCTCVPMRRNDTMAAVSYTHLTLPTSDLV